MCVSQAKPFRSFHPSSAIGQRFNRFLRQNPQEKAKYKKLGHNRAVQMEFKMQWLDGEYSVYARGRTLGRKEKPPRNQTTYGLQGEVDTWKIMNPR